MNTHRTTLLAATLVFALASGGVAIADDYVGYAQMKKGDEIPLPENVRDIVKKNAKQLVGIRWGEYNGKKIRIGVLEADNRSDVASYSWAGGEYSAGAETVPVNGIDALLSDAMVKTNRFTILTRNNELNNVLDEQDLGDSGRVAKPSAAKIGQVLGAQYLVQIVINSYQPNVGGKKVGLGGFSRKLRGLGGAKVGKNKSYVQMTFKLINAETSEVVASEVVEATISDFSFSGGGVGWGAAGALGGFLSSYSKTPIGAAVMAATNIGVVELIKQVGNLPLTGSVVKVEDSRAIVNLGEGTVTEGETLTAVSKGEEFVDPETGLSLGADEEEVGTLKVIDVKEKYCFVEAVGFDISTLSRGDEVRANAKPQPLQFGPRWEK